MSSVAGKEIESWVVSAFSTSSPTSGYTPGIVSPPGPACQKGKRYTGTCLEVEGEGWSSETYTDGVCVCVCVCARVLGLTRLSALRVTLPFHSPPPSTPTQPSPSHLCPCNEVLILTFQSPTGVLSPHQPYGSLKASLCWSEASNQCAP